MLIIRGYGVGVEVREKFLYLPLNLVANCLIKRRMKPHYFEFYTILENANFCVGMRFTGQGCRKVSKPLNSTNTIIRLLTHDFFSGDKLFLFWGIVKQTPSPDTTRCECKGPECRCQGSQREAGRETFVLTPLHPRAQGRI